MCDSGNGKLGIRPKSSPKRMQGNRKHGKQSFRIQLPRQTLTAVHADDLRRHPARERRGEEQHHAGDFLGKAHAIRRTTREDGLVERGVVLLPLLTEVNGFVQGFPVRSQLC